MIQLSPLTVQEVSVFKMVNYSMRRRPKHERSPKYENGMETIKGK